MKLDGYEFEFHGKILRFHVSHYVDSGRIAIKVFSEDGRLYAVLTVNLSDVVLEEREVIIKTWAENKQISDVARTLTDVFEDTGKKAKAGVVFAEIWRIK